MGRARYPNAKSLLITADDGGSNGSRLRLWKLELQKLSCPRFLWTAICQRGDRGDEGHETRNRRH